MKAFFNNKRGNLLVVGIIGLFLVGLFVFLLISSTTNLVVKEFTGLVAEENSGFNNESRATAQTINTGWAGWLDYAILFLTIGLFIGLFVAGVTVERSPIALIVVFLLLLVSVWAGMTVNNLYYELLAENPSLLLSQEFPIANHIMSNIFLYFFGGMVLFGLGIFITERVGL